MVKCEWCEKETARAIKSTVYWELPDGTRAIEIKEVPGIHCDSCGMEYQKEALINEIEDQLLLIDTTKLGKTMSFEQLMEQPRLLKRNYFNFEY